MNYHDWMKTFENRTPEQLHELIDAINTLEKDVDINREFDDAGLFAGSSGCSIRGAAKEVLKKKEEILKHPF
jgi:alcohol dehydrogenase class IV